MCDPLLYPRAARSPLARSPPRTLASARDQPTQKKSEGGGVPGLGSYEHLLLSFLQSRPKSSRSAGGELSLQHRARPSREFAPEVLLRIDQRVVDYMCLALTVGYPVSGILFEHLLIICLYHRIAFLRFRKIFRNPPHVKTPPIHHPLGKVLRRSERCFAGLHRSDWGESRLLGTRSFRAASSAPA